MRLHSFCVGAMIVFLPILSGCARPWVPAKAASFQEQETSVRDWTAIGVTIADSLAAQGYLPSRIPGQPSRPANLPPVRFNVHLSAPQSRFMQQVGDALQSEILARGGQVSRAPANSIVVNLDVETVSWSVDVWTPEYADRYVTFWDLDKKAMVEAVWKATIVSNDSVTLLARAPVYINPDDLGLYTADRNLGYASDRHLGPVASGMPEVPKPIVRMRYDP